MMPTTDLWIAGEWVPIIAVEGGQTGDMIVTLARPLAARTYAKELVVILRQGPNREPMRFTEMPHGARLRLRTIY